MGRGSFTIGSIAGVRIGLHPSWLVIAFLVTYSLAEFQLPAEFPGWTTLAYWLIGFATATVGVGNTGAEIALDLYEQGARVTLSMRTPTNIVPRDFLNQPVQLSSLRTAKLPRRVRDRVGRTLTRLAFGNLPKHGVPLPAYGPATQMDLYGRTPLIDIGTVALLKAGAIRLRRCTA